MPKQGLIGDGEGQGQPKIDSCRVEEKNDSNYFFNRSLPENKGKPVLREFVIDGFAIYIESG